MIGSLIDNLHDNNEYDILVLSTDSDLFVISYPHLVSDFN